MEVSVRLRPTPYCLMANEREWNGCSSGVRMLKFYLCGGAKVLSEWCRRLSCTFVAMELPGTPSWSDKPAERAQPAFILSACIYISALNSANNLKMDAIVRNNWLTLTPSQAIYKTRKNRQKMLQKKWFF